MIKTHVLLKNSGNFAWAIRHSLMLLAFFPLMGCACDPATTRFFDGAYCAIGGGYAERRNALIAAETQAQRDARTAGHLAGQAGNNLAATEADLSARQRRAREQDSELATLRRRLGDARRSQGDQARLRRAEDEMRRAEVAAASGGRLDADLAARDEAQRRARELIDQLLDV